VLSVEKGWEKLDRLLLSARVEKGYSHWFSANRPRSLTTESVNEYMMCLGSRDVHSFVFMSGIFQKL
jgi:hypothetical protein